MLKTMPFEPGKSGNPGGRPKERPFRDALRIEATAAENGEPCFAKKGSLRWNARQLLELGEPAAIRELADRLDGKVPQAVVGDDEHGPIEHVIRWADDAAQQNDDASQQKPDKS